MPNAIGPLNATNLTAVEGTTRRNFTIKSALGVMSAVLASCGKTVTFAGNNKLKKSDNQGVGENSEDALAGSGANDQSLANNGANGTADASTNTNDPTGAVAGDNGSLSIEDRMDVSAALPGDNSTLLFKLYGTKSQALIAFAKVAAATGLQVGDRVALLKPISPTMGRVLAQREVSAGNDKDVAHIFDNMYLVATDIVWLALTRNNTITLFQYNSGAGDFEGTYLGKPVIDPPSLLDLAHPNYYDHMPVMGFSGPAASVSGDLQQFGSLRPYLVATNTSTWAQASFQIVPTTTAFAIDATAVRGIDVTDAVGRPIATGSTTTEITVSADFLRNHNTVILYTNDNNIHWHRYFQFIG